MQSFVQKYSHLITGILSGFDRLVFRGTLRQISYVNGMETYMAMMGVLHKDFAKHVHEVTGRVRDAAIGVAEKAQRPHFYLHSSQESKEELATRIMLKDAVKQGLICVLSAVEPCMTYDLVSNKKAGTLDLVVRERRCLHVYQYWADPLFGFMSARLQTWFPFSVRVFLNGRTWLARMMDKARLGYVRRDNCFTHLANVGKAQCLMDQQLQSQWPELLDAVANRLNPIHRNIFNRFEATYYWSTEQSEWATDLMFRDQASLDALYPSLVHHGMLTFKSADVLRFLGKRVSPQGKLWGKLEAEVTSDMKRRTEGVRIKHRYGVNSIKAYNKQGSVLRVETTIVDPKPFKVYRPKEGDGEKKKSWRYLRKGIADLQRRSEVCDRANKRYIEALAAVDAPLSLQDLIKGITTPVTWKGRRARALKPWAQDEAALLEAVVRGEFTINGFRNKDLRALLFKSSTRKEAQRQAAVISRKLRLLRAHGLIKKVAHTHRYHVTERGRAIISAVANARRADANQLSKLAA